MTLNMVHMHNDHILFHEKFLGPEIANISKKWYKSSSNFRTAQTINVKVESEVQQLQVVCHCPKHLGWQQFKIMNKIDNELDVCLPAYLKAQVVI